MISLPLDKILRQCHRSSRHLSSATFHESLPCWRWRSCFLGQKANLRHCMIVLSFSTRCCMVAQVGEHVRTTSDGWSPFAPWHLCLDNKHSRSAVIWIAHRPALASCFETYNGMKNQHVNKCTTRSPRLRWWSTQFTVLKSIDIFDSINSSRMLQTILKIMVTSIMCFYGLVFYTNDLSAHLTTAHKCSVTERSSTWRYRRCVTSLLQVLN